MPTVVEDFYANYSTDSEVFANAMTKRKREADGYSLETGKDSKAAKGLQDNDHIDQLTSGILESRENYNNIIELLAIAKRNDEGRGDIQHAFASLFAVFAHLIESGSLKKSKATPPQEIVIVEWLRETLGEFTEAILHRLPGKESSYLPILMGLARVEVEHGSPDAVLREGVFVKTVRKLVLSGDNFAVARSLFVADYIKGRRDSPIHLFKAARYVSSDLF